MNNFEKFDGNIKYKIICNQCKKKVFVKKQAYKLCGRCSHDTEREV